MLLQVTFKRGKEEKGHRGKNKIGKEKHSLFVFLEEQSLPSSVTKSNSEERETNFILFFITYRVVQVISFLFLAQPSFLLLFEIDVPALFRTSFVEFGTRERRRVNFLLLPSPQINLLVPSFPPPPSSLSLSLFFFIRFWSDRATIGTR